MTTSFSNFVRGNLVNAVQANMAGTLLAIVCALQIPWMILSLYHGRLIGITQPELATCTLLLAIVLIALVEWGFRLIL